MTRRPPQHCSQLLCFSGMCILRAGRPGSPGSSLGSAEVRACLVAGSSLSEGQAPAGLLGHTPLRGLLPPCLPC